MSNPLSLRRPTVMVVDDDPESIAILTDCLKGPYSVQVVTTGDEALEIVASKGPPDLITLDVVMPGLDGFETCRRIKAHPNGRDIPIFFLTAKTSSKDEFEGFACGAVDYIQKPLSPALVQARVAAHLELRRSRAELEDRNLLLLERARLQAEVDRLTHHDLNNALTVVLSVPESLLVHDQDLTPEQRRSLELVVKAGRKMLDIMNRSEDFLKLEKGGFDVQPGAVALPPLLEEVIEAQRFVCEAKGLTWKFQPAEAPDVAGDELLLYSLLANLAKNAIEASPPQQVLHLDVLAGKSTVEVVLRNTGPIPLPIRTRFFEKYSTYGKKGGTGLGNYTAALIARAHGGRLEAKVLDEKETEIRLTLPVFEPPSS